MLADCYVQHNHPFMEDLQLLYRIKSVLDKENLLQVCDTFPLITIVLDYNHMVGCCVLTRVDFFLGHHSATSSPSRVPQSSPSHSALSPHGSSAHSKLQSPTPPSATPSPYSAPSSLPAHRGEGKNPEMMTR